MFNNDNIKVFDYIFSTNFIIEDERDKESILKLRKMFDDVDDEYSFWMELMYLVKKNSVFDATDLASGSHVGYLSFPKLTFTAKNMYKEYKKNQILDEINNQGEFNEAVIQRVCKNMCNRSIKEILDYCEENGYLEYKGEPYFWADDEIIEIIADNIEAKVPKKKIDSIHNEINVYGNNNDFSNSSINQNINYNDIDDEIIETIKNLIPELEKYKIDKEIIDNLKQLSSKSKKNKLVDYLISLGSNVTSGLIGYAINYILLKFGIPIF